MHVVIVRVAVLFLGLLSEIKLVSGQHLQLVRPVKVVQCVARERSVILLNVISLFVGRILHHLEGCCTNQEREHDDKNDAYVSPLRVEADVLPDDVGGLRSFRDLAGGTKDVRGWLGLHVIVGSLIVEGHECAKRPLQLWLFSLAQVSQLLVNFINFFPVTVVDCGCAIA